MPYGVKQFFKAAAALIAALAAGACVYLMHAAAFTGGESTYYLYSASSQAEIKDALSVADLAHLKGESAVYVFGRGQEANGEREAEIKSAEAGEKEYAGADFKGNQAEDAAGFAAEIMRGYRASLCFTETVGGTVSYYCYSPKLKGGVILDGQKVNLHIAVREESLAVGSPIIFGGY